MQPDYIDLGVPDMLFASNLGDKKKHTLAAHQSTVKDISYNFYGIAMVKTCYPLVN